MRTFEQQNAIMSEWEAFKAGQSKGNSLLWSLDLHHMNPSTLKLARFWAADHRLIAEREVTAAECWNPSCPAFWSLFQLADGPTARSLGAAYAAFV